MICSVLSPSIAQKFSLEGGIVALSHVYEGDSLEHSVFLIRAFKLPVAFARDETPYDPSAFESSGGAVWGAATEDASVFSVCYPIHRISLVGPDKRKFILIVPALKSL